MNIIGLVWDYILQFNNQVPDVEAARLRARRRKF